MNKMVMGKTEQDAPADAAPSGALVKAVEAALTAAQGDPALERLDAKALREGLEGPEQTALGHALEAIRQYSPARRQQAWLAGEACGIARWTKILATAPPPKPAGPAPTIVGRYGQDTAGGQVAFGPDQSDAEGFTLRVTRCRLEPRQGAYGFTFALEVLVDRPPASFDRRKEVIDGPLYEQVLAELTAKALAGWPVRERARNLDRQLRAARRRIAVAESQVRKLEARRQYLLATEEDGFAAEVVRIDEDELPPARKELAAAEAALALLEKPAQDAEAAFRSEVRSAARRLGPALLGAVQAARPEGERELVEGLRAPLAKVVASLMTADGVNDRHFEGVVAWLDERHLPAPAAPTPAAVGAEAEPAEPAVA